MDRPCTPDCPDRTEDCHGTCERYAKYAAWCEEVREKKREQKERQAALNHGRHRHYAMRMYDQRRKNLK